MIYLASSHRRQRAGPGDVSLSACLTDLPLPAVAPDQGRPARNSLDCVEREHERVTVTRNGRAAAVIISPEDLAELEETLAVLSDRLALAEIREADAAYAAGDVVRGVDAVRALRP